MWEKDWQHLDNFLTILQKNINERPRRGPIWSLNNSKNLHFDNDWGIHANSKNHEEVGYEYNLDSLGVSCLQATWEMKHSMHRCIVLKINEIVCDSVMIL